MNVYFAEDVLNTVQQVQLRLFRIGMKEFAVNVEFVVMSVLMVQ